MRPTALGLKALGFYGLLTIAFYVSPYTNLFFLLLSFFAALVLLGAAWTKGNLRGVSARVLEPRPVPAAADGTRVDVELAARRPARALAVELVLANRRRAVCIATLDALPAGQPLQVRGRLPALPRGIHRIVAAQVRSSAPVGLWRAQVPATAPSELVVHAAPLDPVHAREAGIADGGDASALTAAQGDAGVAGLRAWRQGDPLRLVHWRATARRRSPVVRELDAGTHHGTAVWLDRRCTAAQLEIALSVIVTLALRARDHDEAIDMRTQGLDARFGAGAEPIDSLLRWTAEATVAGVEDAPPAPLPESVRLPQARVTRDRGAVAGGVS